MKAQRLVWGETMAELAVSDPAAFAKLVEVAKANLPEDVNAPAA